MSTLLGWLMIGAPSAMGFLLAAAHVVGLI